MPHSKINISLLDIRKLISIIICFFCMGSIPSIVYSQRYEKGSVLNTQKKLQELGYNPGPLDGIWGKRTKSALKKFQHDNDLRVTGTLDSETKTKLGIIPLEKRIPKQNIPVASIQNGIRNALEYRWKIKKVQIRNNILTVIQYTEMIEKRQYASMIPWICKVICKYQYIPHLLKEIRILNASQNQEWTLLEPNKCDSIIHTPLNQVHNFIFGKSADILIFKSR